MSPASVGRTAGPSADEFVQEFVRISMDMGCQGIGDNEEIDVAKLFDVDNGTVLSAQFKRVVHDGSSQSGRMGWLEVRVQMRHELTQKQQPATQVHIRGKANRMTSASYVILPGEELFREGSNAQDGGSGSGSEEPNQGGGDEPKWFAVPSSIESQNQLGETVHQFRICIHNPQDYPDLEEAWSPGPIPCWINVEELYEVDAPTGKPWMWDLWETHQRAEAKEGVSVCDNALDTETVHELRHLIDEVAKAQDPPDFHPGSRDIVQDIVHPSLYPYIRNVSKLVFDGESVSHSTYLSRCLLVAVDRPKADMWARPYEDSVYQWLPSIFQVNEAGDSVRILSYINNLDEKKYAGLYRALEKLFVEFLPMFEEVYAYARAIDFHTVENNVDLDLVKPKPYEPDLKAACLRNRELKVITKIVEYGLEHDQEFDGVWHVEGMSHENIVATGLYILNRDEDFEGGDLLFKRAFLKPEAADVFRGVPQDRHPVTEKVIEDGLVPLGRLETPCNRMIVFPNSHVHKLTTMKRRAGGSALKSKRRIVVFWLVNPEAQEVITTRDVAPQQDVMEREAALEHRVQLMSERKRYKQDWNVREIELCEH